MLKKKLFKKANRERILHRYYATVGKDSLKARLLIKRLDYKQDAYLLKCIAQTYFDEGAFHEDGTPRVYFNARKIRYAEKYIIKAYKINDTCLDVLFTLGEIRNAFMQKELAIFCYEEIIDIGKRKLVIGDNCTDRSIIPMLVNDSKFQLYRLYFDLGNFKLSKKYLQMYKNGLKKGIDTIYKPIEKYLMKK